MDEGDKVAKALNDLCCARLNARDHEALSEFVQDYFCDCSTEDPPSDNDSDILDDASKMTDVDGACDTLAIETDALVDPSSKFTIADNTDFIGTVTIDVSGDANVDAFHETPIADIGANVELEVDTDEETDQGIEMPGPVIVEMTIPDVVESRTVDEFLEKGCDANCKLFNGKPCCYAFTREHICSIRDQCSSMERSELNNILFGHVMATTIHSEVVEKRGYPSKNRERVTGWYLHEGNKICRTTFLFLHNIGIKKYYTVKRAYVKNGLEAVSHGNKNRLPSHAFTTQDLNQIVTFLTNYAEAHAVQLPGRIPGFKRDDLQLLPTQTSKRSVWDSYVKSCATLTFRLASYRTFCRVWRKYKPHLVITTPKSDLCWICQRNSMAITEAANKPVSEKLEILKEAQCHLEQASRERQYYKTTCEKSRTDLHQAFDNPLCLPTDSLSPCSHDVVLHLSFDFAQQVHYPSNPLQPGPIYFLTPRKCGIFGVCCEGLPLQVNYLIDEGMDSGKGSNMVVSLLHDFLSNCPVQPTHLELHADNCVGQNKNNTMLQYLLWRVMSGLNHSISLSFMVVGHTKFTPDSCFGLLKQRFRKTHVQCLTDIARVVEESATVNTVKIVGSESGIVYVPIYNWLSHFTQYFKKVSGIKSYHQFLFHNTQPGIVICKEYSDSDGISIQLNKSTTPVSSTDLPTIIPPPGLSSQRQWYLYEKIRPFCEQAFKDISFPLPSTPRPTTPATTPVVSPLSSPRRTSTPTTDHVLSPPVKRPRSTTKCGICGQTGHNRRSCKQQL